MYVLALLFCLKASPSACKPLVYPGLEPSPLMGCMVAGQMYGARLLASDPALRGYALSRAVCEPADKPRERGA